MGLISFYCRNNITQGTSVKAERADGRVDYYYLGEFSSCQYCVIADITVFT